MIYKVKTTRNNGNYEALKIASEISAIDLPHSETITFDFTEYNENYPFSNLIIANSINNFKKRNKNERFLKPYRGTYLKHMGFYNMFGANYGNRMGEAESNCQHVPIEKVTFDVDIYQNYRMIEEKSEKLVALLKFDTALSAFLKYLFIEAMRNTYEHADVQELYLTAQKWKKKPLLEIAISDTGCGICNSLRKYITYSSKDEKELILLACNPGISARSNFSFFEKEDPLRNSGYGLYAMRKLAVAYGGSFWICSGNYALYEDRHGFKIFNTNYSGTTIAIRVATNVNLDFNAERKRILSEGEKEAQKNMDTIHSASKSSSGQYKH